MSINEELDDLHKTGHLSANDLTFAKLLIKRFNDGVINRMEHSRLSQIVLDARQKKELFTTVQPVNLPATNSPGEPAETRL